MEIADISNGPNVSPIVLNIGQYAVSPEKKKRLFEPMTAKDPHRAVFLSNRVRDVQCFVGVNTMSNPFPLGAVMLCRSHQLSSTQLVIPRFRMRRLTPIGTILRTLSPHVMRDIEKINSVAEVEMNLSYMMSVR